MGQKGDRDGARTRRLDMKLGMVGLGRMGGNMTVRLVKDGHEVVAFDPGPGAVERAVTAGATGASSLEDMVGKLEARRTVWLMVPAGDITEQTVQTLRGLLSDGDSIVDG